MAASAGVSIVELSYLLPRIVGDDELLLLSFRMKSRFSIDLLLLIRGLPSIVISLSFDVDCNVKVSGYIDLNTPLSVEDDDTVADTKAPEGEKAFVVSNDKANAASNNILDDAIANTDIQLALSSSRAQYYTPHWTTDIELK